MGYNAGDEKHRRLTSTPKSKLCFPTWIMQSPKRTLTQSERNARIETYAKRAEKELDLFDDTEKTE